MFSVVGTLKINILFIYIILSGHYSEYIPPFLCSLCFSPSNLALYVFYIGKSCHEHLHTDVPSSILCLDAWKYILRIFHKLVTCIMFIKILLISTKQFKICLITHNCFSFFSEILILIMDMSKKGFEQHER